MPPLGSTAGGIIIASNCVRLTTKVTKVHEGTGAAIEFVYLSVLCSGFLSLSYFFVALPSITVVHFVPSCEISKVKS